MAVDQRGERLDLIRLVRNRTRSLQARNAAPAEDVL
jgi:hypothetical protein